jgi:hypothetical protein
MADARPTKYSPADRYQVRRAQPGEAERLPMLGRYVEVVWSELLGPTATLVARRIGHVLEGTGDCPELSLAVVGKSLGVAPGKVRWSLARLAYFELITIASKPNAVVASGMVIPVPTRLFAKLSPAGLLEHRELLTSGAGRRLSLMRPNESSESAMRRQNGRAL